MRTPDFVLTGFWIYITIIISTGLYHEITRSRILFRFWGVQTLQGFGIWPGLGGWCIRSGLCGQMWQPGVGEIGMKGTYEFHFCFIGPAKNIFFTVFHHDQFLESHCPRQQRVICTTWSINKFPKVAQLQSGAAGSTNGSRSGGEHSGFGCHDDRCFMIFLYRP